MTATCHVTLSKTAGASVTLTSSRLLQTTSIAYVFATYVCCKSDATFGAVVAYAGLDAVLQDCYLF